MTPNLWPHQRDGLAFCTPKAATMLAGGVGVGKSAMAAHEIAEWGCRRVLVICPPSVRGVWRRMLPMHCPRDVRPVILDRGSVAMRTAQADAACRDPSPCAVVVNTEAIWREPLARWILAQRWDAVFLDESHLGGIKTDGTHASRFVAQLTPISGHRQTLTGTPLAHDPVDAWGQYRFLDPGIFPMPYADYFRRYAAPRQVRCRKRLHKSHDAVSDALVECFGADSPLLTEWGDCPDYTGWLPGIRNVPDFTARIAPVTWYAPSVDVLDLPALITDERSLPLGDRAQEMYDHLIRCQRCLVDGEVLTVDNYWALITRLQQITSGFLPGRGGIHRIDTAKRNLLHDLLAEAREPAVVFCRYHADLDTVQAVAASLRLRYAELSHRRKDALTPTATLADGVDVAGVQPQSGGVGVDFSRARLGIWYSRARSLPEYDQGIGRLHRPGTKGTRIYSLVASDTIDADIAQDIRERREIISGILARIRVPGLTRAHAAETIPDADSPQL